MQDPRLNDVINVEGEDYRIAERCPCEADSGHTRWFLESQHSFGDGLSIAQMATLAKEWDEDGEVWWWFGHRIAPSDVRRGEIRLPAWLAKEDAKAPKNLSYEGKRYKRLGEAESVSGNDEGDADTIALTLWEYVDSNDIESLLIEQSPEGHLAVYHGAYYDPSEFRLSNG